MDQCAECKQDFPTRFLTDTLQVPQTCSQYNLALIEAIRVLAHRLEQLQTHQVPYEPGLTPWTMTCIQCGAIKNMPHIIMQHMTPAPLCEEASAIYEALHADTLYQMQQVLEIFYPFTPCGGG